MHASEQNHARAVAGLADHVLRVKKTLNIPFHVATMVAVRLFQCAGRMAVINVLADEIDVDGKAFGNETALSLQDTALVQYVTTALQDLYYYPSMFSGLPNALSESTPLKAVLTFAQSLGLVPTLSAFRTVETHVAMSHLPVEDVD